MARWQSGDAEVMSSTSPLISEFADGELTNPPELSVVLPCLNEEATVAVCIEQVRKTLDTHGISGEIIVADNGSVDKSREIAQGMGARVVLVENRGYGNALTGGINA